MHTIFLGYSYTYSFRELQKYFDINPDHEDGVSKFEEDFGCEYIEPGSFEIYDKQNYNDHSFDAEFIQALLPFSIPSEFLRSVPFDKIRTIFYLKTKNLDPNGNESIQFLSPIKIQKFDFE